MAPTLISAINEFKKILHVFDPIAVEAKERTLHKLASVALRKSKLIQQYQQVLIFLCAHPANATQHTLAERELRRLAKFMKLNKQSLETHYANSGLPYTLSNTFFSHDCLTWLLNTNATRITFDRFEDATHQLNDVLGFTLPMLEKSITTAGWSNTELLQELGIKSSEYLSFIVDELSKINNMPYIKDFLFDSLGIYVNVYPADEKFSLPYNRIATKNIFYHQMLLRHFDHIQLFSTPLPNAAVLTEHEINETIGVIKTSLALLQRETDPVTYLDPQSLRLYHLERGITIAIYTMISQRQLALESYVGYTLFKNGFPAAYGGGWVFGHYANFGINIFESFRGGESGYILCQLLRLYRQVFGSTYFEIEPYQFGLDNPEGIASGAFWFYYRYGFRPLDNELLLLAKKEKQKLEADKNYRTSLTVLRKFTRSNMGLVLDDKIPPSVTEIATKVSRMIKKDYRGNRTRAVDDSIKALEKKTAKQLSLTDNNRNVIADVALWVNALSIKDESSLQIMMALIDAKPHNVYRYQQLLLNYFDKL